MGSGPETTNRQFSNETSTISTPEFVRQNQGAAGGLLGSIIGGEGLDPNSNPFLQGAFDRGADAIQNRLQSQFAGGGRNLGASRSANTEGLADLATGIFGGNFQQERNRQMQALAQVLQGTGRTIDTSGSQKTTESTKQGPLDRVLGIAESIFNG